MVHYYGKIGASKFTKATPITGLIVLKRGIAIFICFQGLFGAESDANSAFFAPVLVYSYILG